MPLSIKQIQQKIKEQARIDTRQGEIDNRTGQLKRELAQLQNSISEHLAGLQELEKPGVKSLLALAKGQRKSGLEATRTEYHRLLLHQKELEEELELLDYESGVLTNGHTSMKELNLKLSKAIKFKELNLQKINKGFSSGLFKIDQEIAKIKNRAYRLQAISSDGDQAIKLLNNLVKILNTADTSSSIEMSGAGASSNFKKKKFAEKARIKGHNTNVAIERFYERYCGMYRDQEPVNRTDEFTFFVEIFESYLITDNKVHYSIENCQDHLLYNLQCVQQASEKLKSEIVLLDKEMEAKSSERLSFIADF